MLFVKKNAFEVCLCAQLIWSQTIKIHLFYPQNSSAKCCCHCLLPVSIHFLAFCDSCFCAQSSCYCTTNAINCELHDCRASETTLRHTRNIDKRANFSHTHSLAHKQTSLHEIWHCESAYAKEFAVFAYLNSTQCERLRPAGFAYVFRNSFFVLKPCHTYQQNMAQT